MFDENRTIQVELPDGTSIYITNVNSDVTSHQLLEKIASIKEVSQNFEQPYHLRINNRQLFDWETISSNNVKLGLFVDEVQTPTVIVLLFFISHILPFLVFFFSKSYVYVIFTYLICMIFFGIICLIFKPNYDISHFPFSKIPILSIIILFFQSFLPSFRLENILLDNH